MITSLQQVLDGQKAVSLDEINLLPENRPCGIELQERLCDLGLLDPTIGGDLLTPFGPISRGDGKIGLNTRNSIYEFCRLAGITYKDRLLTLDLADALLRAEPDTFLPMHLVPDKKDDSGTKLAKLVLRYMQDKGFWIARSPRSYNIVYCEGMDSDGKINKDTFNEWNDRRFVIRIASGGRPEFAVNDQATTEPGAYYTNRPMNPLGAARIAFGQYKAWVDGLHQGKQPALVQRDLLRVHRDKNKDAKRTNDQIDIGSTFGVNQHTTSQTKTPDFIGPYSAGCLVGRRYKSHLGFLSVVKKDFRYQMNKAYVFMTAVLAGDDVVKFGLNENEPAPARRNLGAAPEIHVPEFSFFDH